MNNKEYHTGNEKIMKVINHTQSNAKLTTQICQISNYQTVSKVIYMPNLSIVLRWL